MEEWLSIGTYSERSHRVLMFDPEEEAVFIPSDVPWPVVWLLSTYHHKYIFSLGILPKVAEVREDLQSFVNKFRWRQMLGSDANPQRLAYQPKGWKTPSCPQRMPPDLEFWVSSLTQSITAACQQRIRELKHRPRGNTFPLIKCAFEWLRREPYTPIKNDKEMGYTLVPTGANRRIDERILNGSEYQECATDPINFNSVAQSYCRLARDIEQYEGFPIAKDIIKSLKAKDHTYLARLVKTCKTHKFPERIPFRNIHASGNTALRDFHIGSEGRCGEKLSNSLISFAIQKTLPGS